MSSIKHKARKILWRFGYDFSRFEPISHTIARKIKLFQHNNIDIVLDIGANVGQFSQQIREDIGYTKKIISFEPLSSAFKILKEKSKNDINWDVFNFALGDVEEEQTINISNNSDSSSILEMLPSHLENAPDSKFIAQETVKVKRLDTIINGICSRSNKIFMKIDTQGYEKKVLDGAKNTLKKIDTIQIEMSLVPLYDGELLFHQMHMIMSDLGYGIVSIEPTFLNPTTGQVLQVDAIYQRL
jgi:FkbM family methyltransferase